MDTLKEKIGIVLLVLCMAVIMAAIWYCLFGLKGNNSMMEGTLVQSIMPFQGMAKL